MSKLWDIFVEVLGFFKEKGYSDEFLAWLDKRAAATESPIDDFAVSILRYLLLK